MEPQAGGRAAWYDEIPLINAKSLREQVYDILRQELQSGQLVPGSAINITEISQRLGVSKTPLRDALIQLEVEGFVTILPRRGVLVNKLSEDEIRSYYEVLGALESAVVLMHFKQIGRVELRKMDQLNHDMREAIERGDFGTYYDLNLNFHEVFLNLSDNAVLQRVILPMKRRLYDFPRRGYIAEWEIRNCDEHQAFLDAIRGGDAEGAARVLREVHWSYAFQEAYIRQFYFSEALGKEEGTA